MPTLSPLAGKTKDDMIFNCFIYMILRNPVRLEKVANGFLLPCFHMS